MSPTPLPDAAPAASRSRQNATRIVFFIAGFGMAAWAPLVPFAKARTGIDEGLLGLLLLCLGLGAILAMPLAAVLTARLGCRAVVTTSALLLSAALPFLATVSSLPALTASLLLFGAGVGALDVSMNVHAVIVERASGRTMMSGFHGLFSLGGIAGAAGMTALLGWGLTPAMAIAIVLVVIAIALAVSAGFLLPCAGGSEGPLFAMPHGGVLLLGGVCFVVFLMEGSVLDWSAVFLSSHHGLAPAHAGIGYAAFACTMTIGRLTGDFIVQRLGSRRVVAMGGICAAAGLGLTIIPSWPVALVGYALVGAGCSNIVPVMFSAAGRQTAMPANMAVAAVTTLGYAGLLAGPAVIGLIAHLASLAAAFLLLVLLLLGVSFTARFLERG